MASSITTQRLQPATLYMNPSFSSFFNPEARSPPGTACPKRRSTAILRVRTGCLACRRRKKKCDEAKPVCSGCSRNKLECNWPRPHEIPRPRRSSTIAGNVHPATPTDSDRTPDRATNTNAVAAGDINGSPASQLLDYLLQNASYISPNTASSSDISATTPPGGSGSSSDSEVDNSMRLSHDAAEDPITDSSTLLSPLDLFDCTFGDEESPNDDTAAEVLSGVATAGPDGLGDVPQSLSLLPGLSPGSLDLLSHYLAVTTRSMDNSAGREDPFVVQLIPLAFGSNLVLHLLLTQSAVHRAAAKVVQDTDLLASEHYNQSLKLFRQGISKYNSGQSRETLPLAVGALIMCLVETAKGDINGTIFDHLMAAHWLLQALFDDQSAQISKQLRTFLIEYYVHAASTSMISIDYRVGPQILLADDFQAHARTLGTGSYVGSLCGCWLDLLLLIPRIFNLGRRFLAENEGLHPATADDFIDFARIHSQIENWVPNPLVHPDIALAGRIFQEAMLVYLHTAVNPLASAATESTHASAVDGAVGRATKYLAELCPTARVNTSLCFPIAVIGSCAYSAEQRHYLRTRLDVMFSVIGLGNIRQTALLLERVWESTSPDPWNICRVMQEHQIWISFA